MKGSSSQPRVPQKNNNAPAMKMGLSKEDEIRIGLEMIPMFQAKEQELTSQYDKLKGLEEELKVFREEQGLKAPQRVQPLLTTSFMNRKPSQVRQAATAKRGL